ncbi:hypothetical protein DENSPDRAFT_879471 [Dentipellis sp. KUC8613]|nr:hypothetical protein DENSPDRAFT_879471 [Dentipellis sp. KUC8613]
MPGDVAALLNHLELPRTARLKFASNNDNDPDNFILFTSISRHLTRAGKEQSPITDLLIRDRMVSLLVIGGGVSASLDEADQTLLNISLTFDFERLSQTLALFLSTLPFESLLSLSIVGGYHRTQVPSWRGIFQRLHNVTFLQTTVSGILPFVAHLHVGADEVVLLPNLEVISIPDFWTSLSHYSDDELHAIQDKIYDIVESRKSRARALSKLALWGQGPADFGTDWIARLKELVPEVTAQPPARPGQSTK